MPLGEKGLDQALELRETRHAHRGVSLRGGSYGPLRAHLATR
jgi:hypothetical protein